MFVRSSRDAYRDLSRSDRSLLMRSAVSLPVVTVMLRAFGYRRTRDVLSRLVLVCRPDSVPESGEVPGRIEAAVRMMDVAAAHNPLPSTCLSRSLGVWFWLQRGGVDCTVHLGVRRGEGSVEAHAWVAGANSKGPEDFLVIYPAQSS